ncbi:MAG: hypothetical protein ACLVHS_17160 [Blautia wexlerae]
MKSSGNMKPDQKGDMLSKAHQEELIQAGDCRAISEGILGICRYEYSGKASGRT